MKLEQIYSNDLVKEGFYTLPKNFIEWFKKDEAIEPWKTFKDEKEKLLNFYKILKEKYPQGLLLPFAYIHDLSGFCNDGWPIVACFDLNDLPLVRIYDFSSPENSPWMNHSYKDFAEWLRMAKEESLTYQSELDELQNCDYDK